MTKSHSPLGPNQIITVRLDEIVEQDAFTAQLLTAEQYETDVTVDIECWDPVIVELLAFRLLPILVRRQNGYHFLGSGLDVRLLQEIFEPHDEIRAFVLDTQRVSNTVKLHVLACDLLLMPPFFRTRRFLPRRNMRLWEAIAEAGGTPIRGKGLHAFARATGYSHNALREPTRSKSARAERVECERPPVFAAAESEA
jgi:hypothetical protein